MSPSLSLTNQTVAHLVVVLPSADLKAVANFLRNKSGIKLRVGVLNGKRVDYFKGLSSPVLVRETHGADDAT